MAITSLLLTWLVLAVTPAQASDLVTINKRNFKIPILIEPAVRPRMKLLKLYVSTDQGQTWSEAATGTPDQDHFAYYAPADGLYWFTVAVVDQKDVQQPPDPYKVPPNQKILVDSAPPEVKITTAERQNDDVSVSWEIKEEHPDLESLRLEYRAADAPSWALWYAVPINRDLNGQAHLHLESPAAITLHLELKDLAGNVGSDKKDIAAATQPDRLTAAPPPSPPPAPIPTPTPTPAPVATVPPPAPPAPVAAVPASAPPVSGSPLLSASAAPLPERQPAPAPLPRTTSEPLPLDNHLNTAPTAVFNPPPGAVGDTGTRVVAWSPNTDPGPLAAGLPGSSVSRGGLPNVSVVNDPQVSLEYKLDSGPSGIAKVELFLTEDDGKTWRFYAEDKEKKSPLTMKLPGQGVFGLRIVTTSGAGLTEGPPNPGDAPDVRIEVDTTPPMVQLYEPRPDPQRPDHLVLSWNATDRNLTPEPVTLEYAEPGGEWKPIASNQPASGTYSWPLPKPLAHAQLRVTALDTAGNRSVAETRQPILVDLNKPHGRIVGLSPINKHSITSP